MTNESKALSVQISSISFVDRAISAECATVDGVNIQDQPPVSNSLVHQSKTCKSQQTTDDGAMQNKLILQF